MLTDAQLLARQSGIGASEIAAVCGLDPSKAPIDVWLRKTGRAEREPENPTGPAAIGNALEAVVASIYAQQTHKMLNECPTMTGENCWEIATPDRHIVGENRGIEIKVVGLHMAWHWRDGVPDYVRCQVQWQMLVTGWESIDVVALVGGTDYQVHTVQRDDEWIALMRAVAAEFWGRVLSDTPPEIDGSDGWRGFIKRLFPASKGALRTEESAGQLAKDYADLSEQEKCVKQAKEVTANRLRMLIGDDDGVRGAWGKATNRSSKDGKRSLKVTLTSKETE